MSNSGSVGSTTPKSGETPALNGLRILNENFKDLNRYLEQESSYIIIPTLSLKKLFGDPGDKHKQLIGKIKETANSLIKDGDIIWTPANGPVMGFDGGYLDKVHCDMCFKIKLNDSHGEERLFHTGVVEVKTKVALPVENLTITELKRSDPYKKAVGQSSHYSVVLFRNLAGVFGWEKLYKILGDYHVDHVVVTPEVVIMCRLGFNNFDSPLFYTHSEEIFEGDERTLVFSRFLRKQKEICEKIRNLPIEDRESKHCWLPLLVNDEFSKRGLVECGTSNSNIWKDKENYYKRVNGKAATIYNHIDMPDGRFVATRECLYFYKIRSYGSRIERKDIQNKKNTIEIFIDLVEQLKYRYDNERICHRDIRLPNIVFEDGKATLIDWDYANLVNETPSAIMSTFLDYDKMVFYEVVPERDLYALSCLALWGMWEMTEDDLEPDADNIDWKFEYNKYKNVEYPPILFKIAEILCEPYNDYKVNHIFNGECHKEVLINLETIDLEENQDVKKRKVT